MNIRSYTFEEFVDRVKEFHGSRWSVFYCKGAP